MVSQVELNVRSGSNSNLGMSGWKVCFAPDSGRLGIGHASQQRGKVRLDPAGKARPLPPWNQTYREPLKGA